MSSGLSTAGPNTVVYFSVEGDPSAGEITRRIGVEPTVARRHRERQADRDVTDWRLDLSSSPIAYDAIHDGGERLLAMGDDVAAKVGLLVDQDGATATLVVVQHISDDRLSKGMSVSADVLAWLARARASITFDQYS